MIKSSNIEDTIKEITGIEVPKKPKKKLEHISKPIEESYDASIPATSILIKPLKLNINRPNWINELLPKEIKFPETEKLEPTLKDIIKAVKEQEFPKPVKEVSVKKPSWWELPDFEKPILSFVDFFKKYFDKNIVKTEVQNKIEIKNPVKVVTIKNPQKEVKVTNLKKLEKNTKDISSQLWTIGNIATVGGGVDTSKLATKVKQDDLIGNYAFQYAEDSGDSKIFYIGEAPIGSVTSDAVWRIQKYNTNSGIIKQWADGDANFDNVWDNREEISYS